MQRLGYLISGSFNSLGARKIFPWFDHPITQSLSPAAPLLKYLLILQLSTKLWTMPGRRCAGVDWLEAGTPLILGEGLRPRRRFEEDSRSIPSWLTSRLWMGVLEAE